MKHLYFILIIVSVALPAAAQKALWGMAAAKGATNGTIFKTDSAGNGYTDVYTFADALNGLDPYGSLMQATDGKLYGLTTRGGIYGYGVLFQIDPATGVYNKKHDFDSVNGRAPYGSLLQAANGKLYGMTHGGGSFAPVKDRGILFEYDLLTGLFVNKKNLVEKNATWPFGSLVQGNDGYMYGLTSGGGGDGTGMVFRYDNTLDSFQQMGGFISGPAWEGYAPHGQMVQATNGKFYGLSRYGQAMGSGGGVIFQFDAADGAWDRMSYIYKLSELAPDSANGYETMGSLIQASDGQLYGMAQYGGANGAGTIFSYNTNTNTFTKQHDFNAATEGYAPLGTLMQAANGMLYGLTTSPGGQARLFQFDTATGAFTTKANVTGTPYYTALIEVSPVPADIAAVPIPNVLTIFPNPVHTHLSFTLNKLTGNAIYELLDVAGRVLQQGEAKPFNTLNVAHLPPGKYIIKVLADGQAVSKTIIKE